MATDAAEKPRPEAQQDNNIASPVRLQPLVVVLKFVYVHPLVGAEARSLFPSFPRFHGIKTISLITLTATFHVFSGCSSFLLTMFNLWRLFGGPSTPTSLRSGMNSFVHHLVVAEQLQNAFVVPAAQETYYIGSVDRRTMSMVKWISNFETMTLSLWQDSDNEYCGSKYAETEASDSEKPLKIMSLKSSHQELISTRCQRVMSGIPVESII